MTFFHIPNIEPIDTRQSILDEPSNGSNETTYFPFPSDTSIHLSFSSDTITPTCAKGHINYTRDVCV